MARQTYYVTRDMKHPLYRTRMLTAGQELDLDASAARLYRRLGVPLADEKPRGRIVPAVEEVLAAEVVEEKPAEQKPAPKKRATRKRKAKK